MKVYGARSIVRVDMNGMNFFLRACGHALRQNLANDEWYSAYMDADILVEDEECLEMEYKLKGIHARDLNPARTYDKEKDLPEYDELYDEYLDYIDNLINK